MTTRPKPPEGYETWLDYAVASMETRQEHLNRLFDNEDCPRQDMRSAAREELRDLRALVASSQPDTNSVMSPCRHCKQVVVSLKCKANCEPNSPACVKYFAPQQQ